MFDGGSEMKIKILAFLLGLCLLTSTGCGDTQSTDTDENDETLETSALIDETEPETETESLTETNVYSEGSTVGAINIVTNSGPITGAKNISIPRPKNSGRTISAADYLSPENTGTQNATGFSTLLTQIKASYDTSDPITMIDIPTGVYRIKSSRQYTVHFKNLTNLIVEGNDSLFIFEDSDKAINSAAFFALEYCDTIELRNFSVDFDWAIYPLFVIGEVISSDTATNSVTFRIDSHKLPDAVTVAGGRTWDPDLDNRSETVGFVPYPYQ